MEGTILLFCLFVCLFVSLGGVYACYGSMERRT